MPVNDLPGSSSAGTAAAAAAPAQLTVVVIPFGTAAVDGRPPHETPLKLDLPAGPHVIRAERQGQTFERTVQLEPNQAKRVVFQ